MPDYLFIPSVDLRIGGLEEHNRQQRRKAIKSLEEQKKRQCITLSREYGCEAYPVAEKLCKIMQKQSGEEWVLMDKALLDAVAHHHNLSKEILENLGDQNRYLVEFLSTFSSRWKSHEEHFRLLSKYIISLAEEGNVVIMGRGGAVVTHHLDNCYHFRMFASMNFKVASIARRLNMDPEEAEQLIEKRQLQRDRFNREYLNLHKHDLRYYDMLFNNDRMTSDLIAETIADYVLKQ